MSGTYTSSGMDGTHSHSCLHWECSHVSKLSSQQVTAPEPQSSHFLVLQLYLWFVYCAPALAKELPEVYIAVCKLLQQSSLSQHDSATYSKASYCPNDKLHFQISARDISTSQHHSMQHQNRSVSPPNLCSSKSLTVTLHVLQ